jgi:methyl-accepting chemotaxis protein
MRHRKNTRSLAFKLVAGGIGAVVIPLLVVGLFSVVRSSSALETLGMDQARQVADDLASMTQLVLEEELKAAEQLALNSGAAAVLETASGGDASAEAADFPAYLGRIMKKQGDFYEVILLTDSRGTVVADGSDGKSVGISIQDRPYFQEALTGKANVGDPVKSKLSGLPVLPVCAPVLGPDGRVLGTFVAVLEVEFLTEKITATRIGETGYPFLMDDNGLVVAHPNQEHILKLDLTREPGMEAITDKMLAGEKGVEAYVFEGIDKIAGFAPVPLTDWSIGVTQPAEEFLRASNAIRNVILLVGASFLAATVLAVLFFARSITLPVMRAVQELTSGAEQVASASTQVSSASQSLAEGASEQAASIEETSSSLEEMSSMTRQNADNATQANTLMREANKVAKEAGKAMSDLDGSMSEITTASEETQKIIKTIDEIAFQTNLLALNAAVEAARAGEAGAGFAVVADEVRNLALRAAEAAKNTAGLIENTVGKVGEGSELVTHTNRSFSDMVEKVARVGELVDEIAAASNEQAQGIDQVNKAVAEMDKVVQQNAANAEESASASEELNAQAEQMEGIVGDLVRVVGGDSGARADGRDRLPQTDRTPSGTGSRAVRTSLPARTGTTRGEVNPKQLIPMEDEDFREL